MSLASGKRTETRPARVRGFCLSERSDVSLSCAALQHAFAVTPLQKTLVRSMQHAQSTGNRGRPAFKFLLVLMLCISLILLGLILLRSLVLLGLTLLPSLVLVGLILLSIWFLLALILL